MFVFPGDAEADRHQSPGAGPAVQEGGVRGDRDSAGRRGHQR